MRRLATTILVLSASLFAAGCVSESSDDESISPQPQPVLFGDNISILDTGSTVKIIGGANALGLGPGTVKISNLSLTNVSAEGPFPADGSFELSLEGEPSHHFRLEASSQNFAPTSGDFTADPVTGKAIAIRDK